MKLHEYQAKKLLAAAGVAVPQGVRVRSPACVQKVFAAKLDKPWVVKAQIHAGGRGKGKFLSGAHQGKGGVELVSNPRALEQVVRAMLGHSLRTAQTGAEGQIVRNLWVEAGSQIDREIYLSLVPDRAAERMTLVASAEGGMDIETVAEKHPEAILRLPLDPSVGWSPHMGRSLVKGLALQGAAAASFLTLVRALIDFAERHDASLVEINPLAITKAGQAIALDAKIQIDDSALFRQPRLAKLEDRYEMSAEERQARAHDLSYVKLDGEIGCMVNGAGLAMATMDIIAAHGGTPANFLDVGGGATREKVEAAFRIILRDKDVRTVLVNIFGGIMRCDVIAEGVVAAARNLGLRVPLVVRLEGTKVAEGKKILSESGLEIIPADTLADAATKAVAAAQGVKQGAKQRVQQGAKQSPKKAAKNTRGKKTKTKGANKKVAPKKTTGKKTTGKKTARKATKKKVAKKATKKKSPNKAKRRS